MYIYICMYACMHVYIYMYIRSVCMTNGFWAGLRISKNCYRKDFQGSVLLLCWGGLVCGPTHYAVF